jgi:uncharacterized protein (TIGR00725 family)
VASAEESERARSVGRTLAEGGAVVVTGGRTGVMEAASRGAKEGVGTTVGILPGLDRAAANEFVDIAVPTGLGEARNALVVRCADAVVAVGGEFGTLSEMALTLKAEKPLVGIGTWELAKAGEPVDAFERAETPEAAAARALELAAERGVAGL